MFLDIYLRSRLSLGKQCCSQFVRAVNIELVAEETLFSPRRRWTKSNPCDTMFFHYSAAPLSPFYLTRFRGAKEQGQILQKQNKMETKFCNIFPFFSVMTVHCKQIFHFVETEMSHNQFLAD